MTNFIPSPVEDKKLGPIIVTLALVAVLIGGGIAAYFFASAQLSSLVQSAPVKDYTGQGTGEVTVQIAEGEYGGQIGDKLEEAGVIKDSNFFYQTILSKVDEPTFHEGTFTLAKGMSSEAALAILTDPNNRTGTKVTIPEGSKAEEVYVKLSEATGIPVEDFKASAADFQALGVPAEAPSIEGFLFPATYTFPKDSTSTQILQSMVTRTFESLDSLGVDPEDRFRVITMAALIQKEAGSVEDMGKVSRVFNNRLAVGMNLQSDATVSYGSNGTTVETTPEQRADAGNLYNTYANPGLPVGPISNPGDDAIKAAMNPTPGDWLFFVTVNLETGETVFSTTEEEHAAAVEELQAWWAEHPEVK